MIEAFKSDLERGSTPDYTLTNTWTSMGEILSFTPPTQSTNVITPPVPLNATSRTATPIAGSSDPGTATVTLSYATGVFAAMKLLQKNATKTCFRNKLGAAATKAIAFNGWIKEIGMPEESSERLPTGSINHPSIR